MSAGFRDIRFFRPYPDEVPWELLEAAIGGPDAEDTLAQVLELNLVRVAKRDGRVVGAYGIRPLSATRYELVALAVAEGQRRQGFGHWLLGHALGLAESKGAREVVVRGHRARRFLARVGFQVDGSDQLLTLTPE
jgi:N-acetylglutamate synthase-like GNAT family acetyltransferase